MTTLHDFQQEHLVTVIHLYRPDPKDWFRDVMVYLNRVNDCRRRVEAIRSRAALLDEEVSQTFKDASEAGVEFWEIQMDFRPEGVTLYSITRSADL